MNLWISLFERWIGWLYGIVNDYGIAIILITVCVRLLLLPLNLKQRKSMEQLGKEDGTGAKGCLLSLVQFPIMLCLYHAIRQTAAVDVKTMLLPWVPSLLVRDPWLILPIATLLIQLLPQLYPYFHRFEPLALQRPSVGMIVAMLIMNGMFICVIPSGIGLYYFMSGLFQAAEQFVYYQGRVHRLQSAE